MRYLLTDDHWAARGLLAEGAKQHHGGQAPRLFDRSFFEALLGLARTGIPWGSLPAEFGAWDSVYHRFRPWDASGARRRRFEALTTDSAFGECRRVLIDSTIDRAHPHAGTRRQKKVGAERSAKAKGLGRSRGGLSTKVVVTAAAADTALEVDVVPGQAGDAPLLVPMLDRTLERVRVIDELVGDRAFDGDDLRCVCIDRDVNPNIPLQANRGLDLWAGDGGRPMERNQVERRFGQARQFRRIATQYEKLQVTYLGLLHLVLGFICLRKRTNVNTP
jgi:transposase